jgi:hypothetical protein
VYHEFKASLGYIARPVSENKNCWALMAQLRNPSYLGGIDQESQFEASPGK